MDLPPRETFPEKRRSPRFQFDSLVRMTSSRFGTEVRLWGRSTDLSQLGIGVTISADLTRDEVVALQIQLPKAKIVTINGSVRYCNQGRCGLEFQDSSHTEIEAIRSACAKLRRVDTQP
jgi:PilZ domain